MRNKLIAQRYSKALIDLAVERNQLEDVKADIDFIRSAMTPELRVTMASAVISDHKKIDVWRAVMKGKVVVT